MNTDAFEAALRPLGRLRCAEPLSHHTTFAVGGPADWFLVIHQRAALIAAVRAARHFAVPYLLISGGSNILASDAGVRGLVIDNRTRQIDLLEDDPARRKRRVEADAGVSLATLAHRATRLGMAGLEWAAGIPGTVGGGVLFNAGAHGHTLSEVLDAAQVLDTDLEVRWLRACQLELGYRGSSLSREAPRRWVHQLLSHSHVRNGQSASLCASRRSHSGRRRANSRASSITVIWSACPVVVSIQAA